MAVIDFQEQRLKRPARETERGLQATRSFRAQTDSENDSGLTVLAYTGTPNFGDPHPDNSTLTCNSRSADTYPGGNAKDWLVTCNYSDEIEFAPNPLNEPPRISWPSEQYQVPAVKDRNGEGVVNSAGDPFDPPPMKDQSRRIVMVTRNVSQVPIWVIDYEDAVNSDQFTVDGFTVPVQKAKCQRIHIGEKLERGGIEYRTISIEIHLSREGWNLEPLDEGFRVIDPNDSTRRNPIYEVDDDGVFTDQKVTAPVLLDGNGQILDDPSPSNAVYREFEVYPLLPFSALPLS